MDYAPGRFCTTVLRSELKYRARSTLSGKWGNAALTILVYGLIVMACGIIPVAGPAILAPPLELGLVIYFLNFYRYGDNRLSVVA
jgi:uncharacterized membrane protein